MPGFKGMGGSATFETVAIDNLRSWSLELPTINTFDWAVKGDTIGTVEVGTAAHGTAQVVCVLDYATAQQDLLDLIKAAGSAEAVPGALVLLAATGKSFTCQAIPVSASASSPEGDAMSEVTIAFRVAGAIAIAWV